MAYLQVFDAIQTSWKELYNSLLMSNPVKLCQYIQITPYLYSSLSNGAVIINNFAELREHFSELGLPMVDFDATIATEAEIIAFLSNVMKVLTDQDYFTQDLIIERRDYLIHSTEDEQVLDIEEIFGKEVIRGELRAFAKRLNLQNYKIRSFVRIKKYEECTHL